MPKKPAKKPASKISPKPKKSSKEATPKTSPTPREKPKTLSAAGKTKAVPKATHYFYAAGKRKTSVASVRLFSNGKGTVTINDRAFENYFPIFTDQDKILAPLRITNTQKAFSIAVKVRGGGVHAQAEAIRHGIAKALLQYDSNLRSIVKPMGFLTRDARIKERKKYGLKRARRAPQWQKR